MFRSLETLPEDAALIPPTTSAGHTPWIVLDRPMPVLFMLARFKGEQEPKLILSTDGKAGCLPPRLQQVRWLTALMPPYITGSVGWRMERLHELWEVQNLDTGIFGHLFVAETGDYSDLECPIRLDTLKRERRVYPLRY